MFHGLKGVVNDFAVVGQAGASTDCLAVLDEIDAGTVAVGPSVELAANERPELGGGRIVGRSGADGCTCRRGSAGALGACRRMGFLRLLPSQSTRPFGRGCT